MARRVSLKREASASEFIDLDHVPVELRGALAAFDQDADGVISLEELRRSAAAHSFTQQKVLTPADEGRVLACRLPFILGHMLCQPRGACAPLQSLPHPVTYCASSRAQYHIFRFMLWVIVTLFVLQLVRAAVPL